MGPSYAQIWKITVRDASRPLIKECCTISADSPGTAGACYGVDRSWIGNFVPHFGPTLGHLCAVALDFVRWRGSHVRVCTRAGRSVQKKAGIEPAFFCTGIQLGNQRHFTIASGCWPSVGPKCGTKLPIHERSTP